MDSSLIPLLPPALVVLGYFAYRFYRKWSHQRLISAPFSDAWRAILANNNAVYPRLSDDERERLHQVIKLFLDEKTFYGCAGLEITDEIRLTIAAEACLLLLHRQGPVYPGLTAILVYPSGFSAKREEYYDDGTVSHEQRHMLGESWDNGRIVLAWDAAAHGAADFSDGENVILHEFAHQLDSHSGETNGAPVLRNNSYRSWARVFSENFEDLRDRVMKGQPTVIDDYGATNPAEFFAVATETFFEEPHALQKHRPELIAELQAYYRCDPRAWQ